MDWLVRNALNRDVEREQLNKILKDVRSTVSSVSASIPVVGDIFSTVGKMATTGSQKGIAVTYNPSKKTLDFAINTFTITLSGDVTGSGTVSNAGNVNIAATIDPSKAGIGEAPIDNQSYVRWNGQWRLESLSTGSSVNEIRRRVSMGW